MTTTMAHQTRLQNLLGYMISICRYISKGILMKLKACIVIQISLKFVSDGLTNDNVA